MKKYLALGGFLLFVLFLFRNFLTTQGIIGGDWPYFSSEQLCYFPFLPFSWNPLSGLGMREITPWIDSYLYPIIYIFVEKMNLPWNLIGLFSFFYLTVILSIVSSFVLFKKIFGKGNLLASFLYTCNTYALLLIGGGQMGVVLAYAITPLVVWSFLSLRDSVFEKKKKYAVWYATSIFSIVLAAQMLFDIRMVYVTFLGLFVFFLFTLFASITSVSRKYSLELFFFGFALSSLVLVFLHASWTLPIFMSKSTPVQQLDPIYTSVSAVKFFSFAQFENALSLLQPNWPENMFGKVSFMKPEFLLLPLLAYSSLLFLKRKNTEGNRKEKKYVVYFALVGILGTFLAKGANDPFGNIYLWCFQHIPGFIMFRDSTKWYLLIALSYSVLIPFTVGKTYEFLKERLTTRKYVAQLFLIFIVGYFLFLIRPALFGQLTGTFQKHFVPQEYVKLEKFLNNEKKFSRTLWVPTAQRFGFYSPEHPIISGYNFFRIASPSGVADFLNRPNIENELRESSVKYVVIPFDSEGEIFVKDRKYDTKLCEMTVSEVKKITWLSEVPGFGSIHVFELSHPKDHFWSLTNPAIVGSYRFENPTKYIVNLKDAKKGDILIFAEGYDKYWQLALGKTIISSTQYNRFNSFVLPKDGTYSVVVTYKPQEWVNIGLWISGITLFVIFVFMGKICLKRVLTDKNP